jgi:urea transport system ATP-binding protein
LAAELLRLAHVNQYYRGSHILRDVSFEVPAGKCTTLLGRNGVGKTTLLKCLMGLLPIRSGEVNFAARSIGSLPPYARAALGIGYVPQGRDIFPRLTVEENLRMGLATQKRSAGVPAYIFEMFPVLRDMLGRRGGDLSGGQQQQLAIGRALALRPKLLILDEPTEGIQPNIVHEIGDVIMRLNEAGLAVLLVEQKLPFARRVARTFCMMDRGRTVASGEIAGLDDDLVKQHLIV